MEKNKELPSAKIRAVDRNAKPKGIGQYYVRYAGLISIGLAFLVVQAVCELQMPEYMSNIVSQGIAQGNMGNVWKWGGFMLGVTFASVVSAIFVGFFASVSAARIARDMRADCFARVMSFAQKDYNKFEVSSLITRCTNDISQLQMFTVMMIRLIMFTPIMGIGGIIKAANIASDDMSGLIWVIVGAIAAVVVIVVLLLVLVQPKFMKMQQQIDRVNQVASDELSGMLVIRAFNTQDYEEKRFDRANSDLTKLALFINRASAMLNPIMMLVMNAATIAVVWVAAYQAKNIEQVSNMMAFIQYAMYIVMSFMMISMIFVLMPRAIVSGRRINEILKTQVSVTNREGAETPTGIRLQGDVTFDDVSYDYGGDAPAIEHISFTAPHGKTTALIGSTGSGKSTVINLIPRLADVTTGSITIDGKDVREYNLTDLRNNIGFVPQNNVLFSGTIASNIEYGLDSLHEIDAKTGKEQPVLDRDTAARIAQASDFITAKEEGMDSEIAQGGSNVSGGQKQRLSIARALSKNAPILVFDDSFSALDFKTDAALRAAIREDLNDATIIIVAQRVGTIRGADQIIVLDEGRIVGKGTHEELLQSCEVYRAIARSQMSEEELGL